MIPRRSGGGGGAPRELHPQPAGDEIYRIAREAVRKCFLVRAGNDKEAEISYGERCCGCGVRGRRARASIREWWWKRRTGHYGLPGMRERANGIGGGVECVERGGNGDGGGVGAPGTVRHGTGPGRGGWWWRRSSRNRRKANPAAEGVKGLCKRSPHLRRRTKWRSREKFWTS